jgi:hypothetical protein
MAWLDAGPRPESWGNWSPAQHPSRAGVPRMSLIQAAVLDHSRVDGTAGHRRRGDPAEDFPGRPVDGHVPVARQLRASNASMTQNGPPGHEAGGGREAGRAPRVGLVPARRPMPLA